MQDKLPPVAEIPPERLWAFLTQAAQGLAILHKNDKPHGYLAIENFVHLACGDYLIQGAAWGPLEEWSGGVFLGLVANTARTTEGTARDIVLLGEAVEKFTRSKGSPFASRRKNAVIDLIKNPAAEAFPDTGAKLLRKIRWASDERLLSGGIRSVREAFAEGVESLGVAAPPWRKTLSRWLPFIAGSLGAVLVAALSACFMMQSAKLTLRAENVELAKTLAIV
ncbi:MAG: hypothetical protein WCL32_07785, partial [Planctomycetota bacterium]